MKKWIIGSLVGAILVFSWQGASWMLLGIHDKAMKYTPAEDQIVSTLSSNLQEDGMYFVPMSPPGSSETQKKEMMEKMKGKPWAWIIYGKSWSSDMTTTMITGFIVDIILVVLIISILVRGGLPSFIGIFTGCIAVGIFAFLWGPYTQRNWYNTPFESIQGHLIDAIVAWGLCGLWLGWWLRRRLS